jgi:hypothetical protein
LAAGKSFIKPDINLIPGDFLLARWKKRQKYHLLLVLFAVPLFCLLVYLYPEMLIRRYEREMLEIEDALQQVQDDRLLYEFFLDQKEEYEEILKVYEEISGRGFSAVGILEDLDGILPADVAVDNIHLSGEKRMDLSLRTADPLQAVELLVILEGADAFQMEKYPQIPLADREEIISLTLHHR